MKVAEQVGLKSAHPEKKFCQEGGRCWPDSRTHVESFSRTPVANKRVFVNETSVRCSLSPGLGETFPRGRFIARLLVVSVRHSAQLVPRGAVMASSEFLQSSGCEHRAQRD